MPPFEKTIIYPDQDPGDILNRAILKIVVWGDFQDFVEIANDLAINPPIVDRWVIWIREPDDDVRTRFPGLPERLDNIRAFSLSTINRIGDIIDDSMQIDFVRIDLAYTRAGLPEFNL